ncbi:UNVERIFIED_CONTAM: hypothetical protein HDU68_007873 [Siphonaria sp. JEL0065]|nr:hypothetical protein HDU68_007873 [Siphonaria sp. JEL0065]
MRFHMTCLQPAVTHMPEYEWYCALCLKTHGDDFGFQQEGSLQSLAEFQKVADAFKREYFVEKRKREGIVIEEGQPVYITEEEMEEEFWKLVEDNRFNEDGVEVQYGADLHSSQHGSGFPVVERDPLDPYSKCGWNVNNMPILSDSLFCNIRNDISGMMVPWLYVGMAFSAFCWHTEDHYTYSVNYNHWGDTKTWYGIPASDAVKFEVLMKKKVPELFETNPDLLFHLTTILSPRHLQENMVRCCTVDQRAGEFIVTFPRSYHAGFNQGLNFAEAVNFALPSWLPYGLSCVDRYIKFHKQPVFSHEELVIATALKDSNVKTCLWLKPEIDILCDREISARNKIRTKHASHLVEITETDTLTSQSRDIFCEVCRAYCFCTSISLACSSTNLESRNNHNNDNKNPIPPEKVVCYRHVDQLQSHCECAIKGLIMRIRFTDTELLGLQTQVFKIAMIPDDWLKKYTTLMMEHHRPPLKEMQKLVVSGGGEKIGYVLEEWVTLKGFLVEAEAWVEDTRKVLGGKRRNSTGALAGVARQASSRAKALANAASSSMSSTMEQPIKMDVSNLQPHLGPERTLDSLLALLKRVDVLPFDCPEIGALQVMVADAQDFQERMVHVLTEEPVLLDKVEGLLEELCDPASKIQVIVIGAELLEEAKYDLQWIMEGEECCRNPMSWYEDYDDVLLKGRGCVTHSKDHSALVSALVGFNAVKKRKLALVAELRKKRARGDSWKVEAAALFKRKSLQFYEFKDLLSARGQIPVVKESYDRIVEEFKAVQDVVLRIRRLVQLNPNLQEPFGDSTTWDGPKLSVSVVLPQAYEIIASLQIPVKLEELSILEREVKKVEDWVTKGRRLISKSTTSKPLAEVLKDLESACESATDASNHTDTYCFCRGQDGGGLMVECENCHVWYHSDCLGVGKRTLKKIREEFICSLCNTDCPFQGVAGKRVSLQHLVALMREAETGLAFIPVELNVLKALVESLTLWKGRVSEYAGHVLDMASAKDLSRLRDEVRCLEGYPVEIDSATSDLLYAKCVELQPRVVRASSAVSTVPSEPAALPPNTSEQTWCICHGFETEDMIGCDSCPGWYHFACVGLAPADAAAIESYKCPVCVEREKPVKKIKLKVAKVGIDVIDNVGSAVKRSASPPLLDEVAVKRAKTGSPNFGAE